MVFTNNFVIIVYNMNEKIKTYIADLKGKLKRGDMAKIVQKLEPYGIKGHDVYNIVNGKSLMDQQKLILVMKEVVRFAKQNDKYLEELSSQIEDDIR